MSNQPFVSIVIAAYNSEATIARCIEALQGLDYPGFEIIVVDNASTDRTREVAARYAVTLLDEPRRGWPAARNRAWHYSKAPLVANIDADCFAEPSWLRALVDALAADPQAACAVGRTRVEEGTTLAQRFYASCDPFNIEKYVKGTARAAGRACPWGGGNNCFRREAIEAVGGYDAETYTSGADREFHRRVEALTGRRTVYAPDALIWHVARGSLGEFFRVSAKYAADAVVHAQFDPGVAGYLKGYVGKNLVFIARNLAGFLYRGVRFLVGLEGRQRLVQPLFYSVQSLGTIWGVLRGRRRLANAAAKPRSSSSHSALRTPHSAMDAPAVVAYMSYLGLGLVRALGREGVRVYALDPHAEALGMNSRFCRPVLTPDVKQDAGRYLEFLLDFGRTLPTKAVLYPTGDPTVVLFSRERERLSEFYHYVAPDHATVLKLLTKDGLDAVAREHGIPAPRTVIPPDRAAVEAAAGELQYPVILKPAESHAWKAKAIVDLIGVGTKVIPCATADELLARYDALRECGMRNADCGLKSEIANRKSEICNAPAVIIQEIIPGEDERLVYFCFYMSRESEPLGVFAGRKTRVLPPGFGSASYVESMEDPALTEVALRLLRAVRYRGLGGVEFKLDPRDGVYKLIEFNVRFGLWDALSARCGVNLAHIAWRDALGLPVEPQLRYRTGVKWVSIQRDLSAFRLYRQQGKLTVGRWLRTLVGEKMWAVFAWDDLAPFLASAPGYVWERLAPRLGIGRKRMQNAKCKV